jgi:hypothetical protein
MTEWDNTGGIVFGSDASAGGWVCQQCGNNYYGTFHVCGGPSGFGCSTTITVPTIEERKMHVLMRIADALEKMAAK